MKTDETTKQSANIEMFLRTISAPDMHCADGVMNLSQLCQLRIRTMARRKLKHICETALTPTLPR
jgi:hypothetical protein